ncbi:MAG: lysophospholipase [Methanocella sp.]
MTDASLTQKFQATDGFNLTYRYWSAKKPKRLVVCIHGIGDYSGWFRNIAPGLASDGNEVYALDLRGFGQSLEEGRPRGFVSDFGRHLQDIDEFVTYVGKRHSGKKLYLFGHSLGGIYSVWYSANHGSNVSGVILAAPAVASALNNSKNRVKLSLGNIFAPKKTDNPFPSPETQGRDPEEIKIMLDDPLETLQLTISYLSSIKKHLLQEVWRNAARIEVPTLILQGRADVTVQPEGAQQLYNKLGSVDKRLAFFADAGHWLYDALSPAPPREKISSASRENFVGIIKDWLRNH